MDFAVAGPLQARPTYLLAILVHATRRPHPTANNLLSVRSCWLRKTSTHAPALAREYWLLKRQNLTDDSPPAGADTFQ